MDIHLASQALLLHFQHITRKGQQNDRLNLTRFLTTQAVHLYANHKKQKTKKQQLKLNQQVLIIFRSYSLGEYRGQP